MLRLHSVLFILAVFGPRVSAAERFQTLVLSEAFHSEGTAIADIDGDRVADIVSGAYWYKGPDFGQRFAYAPAKAYPIAGYSDYFFTFARDFDRDGDIDILSIPIPGGAATLHLNPGSNDAESDRIWGTRKVLDDVGNESPTLVDFDRDGVDELVCIHDGRFGYAKPGNEVTRPWEFHTIGQRPGLGRFTHGLGVGDVDGDGRLDLLEKEGWWQHPATENEEYQFHPVKFAESGGAQMYAYDFDGDGDNDVVSSQNAHGFGLCWFERRGKDVTDCLFVRHQIMGSKPSDSPDGLAISQLHALALADIDGDGVKDIVTGKRFWAHGGKDPGAHQLPVLYWFKTKRSRNGVEFVPMQIEDRIGVGTQLVTGDVDNNGHIDIVVGNKLGTFLLQNTGKVQQRQNVERLQSIVGTADFTGGVRNTKALSPSEEKASFVLPPGFEAQLFASEPQIAKPLNMAFDHRGRVWVTNTIEYPYPAADNRTPRDSIKILEDTTGDGHADKVTTFADGLNIPMGLYPYADGVICFSIPNILFLRDTDGDDVADERKVLYGPFDTTRDTHGMCNAFTRGYDGWLYACHGFNNQSKVTGADGHTVTMHSGNTFRMKLDGSRIEHFTYGQVNPFGMSVDLNGDFFTADCHTKPVSLLIPGGFHESFGKPHDGLGFTPALMQHLHGSTAIGGIAIYHAANFPMEYQGSAFGGNVMTSRINRNSLLPQQASIVAREEPDFLISGDPWFRPVDLQVGPDGALYVADFYNKIIGHYEVPLDHPGRDRQRGRIWRIVYKGDRAEPPRSMTDLDRVEGDLESLIKALSSENLTERMLATDAVVDRYASKSTRELLHRRLANPLDANQRIHLLWAIARLNDLSDDEIVASLRDADARVRGHAFQVLGAFSERSSQTEEWISLGLADPVPLVRRYAAGAAAALTSEKLVMPILRCLAASKNDPHLRHALRIALRDHLRNESWFEGLSKRQLAVEERSEVLEICLALESEYAGHFIAENLALVGKASASKLSEYLTFASRFASPRNLDKIVDVACARFGSDLKLQEQLLRSISDGLAQRGQDPPPAVVSWAEGLARQYLGIGPADESIDLERTSIPWTYVSIGSSPGQTNPWVLSTKRSSVDGEDASKLHSSFPLGEARVGLYRSGVFSLSLPFRFYVAGHDGFPDKPLQGNNFVRLRDARTHEELAKWNAPRNDTAQLVEWNAEEHSGRQVYVELVDQDAGNAYAWLAVGRFSETGLNPTESETQHLAAAQLVSDLKIHRLLPVMKLLMSSPTASNAQASRYAKAFASISPSRCSTAVAEAIAFEGTDAELRVKLVGLLENKEVSLKLIRDSLLRAMRIATAGEQRRLAQELSSSRDGVGILLDLIATGNASASLLHEPVVVARMEAVANDQQQSRARELGSESDDVDERMLDQIASRRKSFMKSPGEASKGAVVFSKNCANCHRVAGKGTEVGPNLDGIGNRGLDRVLEDVLLPNRNIDVAFRSTSILTEDGKVLNGLARETVGKQLVLVEQTGKQRRIDTDSIVSQKSVRLSPMPSNFNEVLTASECRDLMAYLLSLTN